jgi:hypothetical protein
MPAGDLCKIWRTFYYHWFIEGYDGKVIHYTGTPVNKRNASIKVSDIEEVLQGGEKVVVMAADPKTAHLTVQKAMSHVGKTGYHVAFNNCEHFAKGCAVGLHTSAQVNRALIVSAMCMIAGFSGGVAGILFGAMMGPVTEMSSTYLEPQTRKLWDRPEIFILVIVLCVLLLAFILKQRQKLILQMQ